MWPLSAAGCWLHKTAYMAAAAAAAKEWRGGKVQQSLAQQPAGEGEGERWGAGGGGWGGATHYEGWQQR